MKRLASVSLLALVLTGCSGSSDASTARDACLDSVKSQLRTGSDFKFDTETVNTSEGLYELGISSKLDDDGHLWTTTGEVTYRTPDSTKRKSVMCMTTIENGEPTEPVKATVR